MARRARITLEVIERGDDITLHFEGNRSPPIWFARHERPTGWAKLHAILDEMEIVEEVSEKQAS
jgi:hypothetical protein